MWDKLCDFVDAIENASDANFTQNALRQVLLEIYRKLGISEIKYDVPLRASVAQVIAATGEFGREKSGGDRPLALTAALFQIIGKYFGLFEPQVRRAKINASDESSGQVADLECLDREGNIVMAVEVKDRTITLSDIEEKLSTTRERTIKEVFFVSAKGNTEAGDVPERIAKEFSAGQNLYVFRLDDLTRSVLALAGEESRREFLVLVGRQLDEFSDTKHRLAWKNTLQQMA